MKRIYTIALTFAAALFLGTSCEKPVIEEEKAAIEITGSNLVIPAKGGDAYIAYRQSDSKPSISVAKSWLSVDVQNDTIWFAAGENPELTSRYSTAVMTVGGDTYNYTIQQRGYNSAGFEPHDITAPAAASQYTMPYEYDEMMVASSEAEWITVTVTENTLTIALAENTALGTPENPNRVSTVAWSIGAERGVIKVTQNNTSFMKPDSNWSVNYDGLGEYEGDPVSIISNTVADPTVSGKYIIYYTDKADFTASGLDMNDYVAIVAEDVKEEINASVDYYNAVYGLGLTFADFLYEESDYEIFDPIAAGEYIAFAIGFTDDAALTGHYASKDFTVSGGDGPNPPASGYEAWLGEWESVRGTTTDKWVISQNVNGQSYKITGIEGQSIPVIANYDASTNSLVLPVQEGLSQQSTSYGTASVGMYGEITYKGENYFITGNYNIFSASLNSDSSVASLTPGNVSIENMGDFTLVDFLYLGELLDGEYAGEYLSFSETPTPLPTTLKRVGGGSGDNPNPPSSGYGAWLGDWESVRGTTTDKWVISQNVNGQSYKITGIEGQSIPVIANYDASTNSLVLPVQEGLSQQSTSYGTASVGMYGEITYKGENYFITGNYNIFSASLNSDSSVASLTPGNVSIENMGDFTLVDFLYLGELLDGEYAGEYLSFSETPTPLPTTLKRVGGGNGGGNDGGDSGNEGSAAFKKWIGSWDVASENGDFTISIKSNVADKSYYISGWQMDEEWIAPLNANFNADGSMTIKVNSNEKVAENVNIGADENCDFYYFGNVDIEGTEYRISSSSNGYDCAKCVIGSDGKVTMSGCEVKLSGYEDAFTFKRLQIYAFPQSNGGPTGGAYTFQNMPSEFPLTWAKSGSTSSVKSMGTIDLSGIWSPAKEKTVKGTSVAPIYGRISSSYAKSSIFKARKSMANAIVVKTPSKLKRIK